MKKVAPQRDAAPVSIRKRLPSHRRIAQLVGLSASIHSAVEPYSVAMSPNEKKRRAKYPRGADKIVRLIASLAQANEVKLTTATTSEMIADLEFARRFEPLREAVQSLSQLIEDTYFDSQSRCWSAATNYYSVLKKMARSDPALKRALKDAIEYFSVGARDSGKTESPDVACALLMPPKEGNGTSQR